MMQNTLILQGWPQPISSHWYTWLKDELEKKDYPVYLPELPTMMTNHPDMETQLAYIQHNVPIDEETVVIGHSLGSLLALRLAERVPYHTQILVGGFDFDDLTEGLESFWPNKINHQQIIQNTQERYVIHSTNDPYVTALIAEAMSKRLQAMFVLIENGGHFMDEDGYTEFPQLLNLLTS